jgi:putative ATP-dependent endonuclease of OLD family
MRLWKFVVRNFKNLEEVEFTWEDIVVVIGENNVGKSNLIQALQIFLSGKQIKDKSLFHKQVADKEHAIEMIGYFDELTEYEQQQPAVKGRMMGSQWILKKKFWLENGENEKWEEMYYSYHSKEQFSNWPENTRSWNNFPEEYQDLIEEIKAELGTSRISVAALDRLKELVKERKPNLVETSPADWVEKPGSGGNWKSNANSILPEFIHVEAVQDASSTTQAKDTTVYGKIVNLIVEKRLINRPEVQKLQEQLARVQALFHPDNDHPDWEKADEITEVEDHITEFLGQVIKASAHIVPKPVHLSGILLPNTVLMLNDGFLTTVENKGHGLQRTLIMALLQVLEHYENTPTEEQAPAYIRPTIFAVDEPELYMHPQMERKMRDTLYRLASSPNYQVICTTHSPVFLDMAEKHSAIVRLERQPEGKVVPFQVRSEIFTGEQAKDSKNRLRMITEFDPAVNELFFAKRVVLVEGDTEIAVFQRAAELLGIFDTHPHVKRDTTFINCHGKWTILLFLEVLNHFKVKYIVFHDEDQGKHNAFGANDRISALVIPPNQRRMFKGNLEAVLGYQASDKDKPIKAIKKVEELHASGQLPKAFIEHVYAAWGVEPAVAEKMMEETAISREKTE